jgi:dihydrofolate reductase
MTVHLIWAEAHHRIIGAAGMLPWHLPEDLHMFRERTLGRTVVMGRATWDSLPTKARPLPGRRNVVLSRNRTLHLAGAQRASTIAEVLRSHRDIWVIGGASIYEAFAPYSTHVVRTRIDLSVAGGDTTAPALDDQWTLLDTNPAWTTSVTGLRYVVEEFTRPRPLTEQAQTHTSGHAALRPGPSVAPDGNGELSETQARVLLARHGHGGGCTGTRVRNGWLFTPAYHREPARGQQAWMVNDNGHAQALNSSPA